MIKPIRIPHTVAARTGFAAIATNDLYGAYNDCCVAYIRAFDSMDSASMNRTYDALCRAAEDYNVAVRDADAKESARKGKEVGPCPHGCYECGKVCESTDMVWCSCSVHYTKAAVCFGCIEEHITKHPSFRERGFTTHNNFRCQVSVPAERIIGGG